METESELVLRPSVRCFAEEMERRLQANDWKD